MPQMLEDDEMRINRYRWMRQLDIGDMVWRKLPAEARPAKRLFPEPTMGPCFVKFQKTPQSVVLEDENGNLVDKGPQCTPLSDNCWS